MGNAARINGLACLSAFCSGVGLWTHVLIVAVPTIMIIKSHYATALKLSAIGELLDEH
jgi:hypothetical protein